MTANNESAVQMVGVGSRVRNVSSSEAAAYLGITKRELKGLRARRAIPFYRIGHRTVTYRPGDLDAFLEKCRVAPEGEPTESAA